MKARLLAFLLVLTTAAASAQVPEQDTLSVQNDSIVFDVNLTEVVITNVKDSISPAEAQQLLILKRRIMRVYPYAKIAAERLTLLNANMAKLKTEKEKKKYNKIVQQYLEDEFEAKLKNLSRKDGQILIKLIHRQTGHTTYDLIKEQKSSWKAWYSSKIAKMFSLDLKATYEPATVAEDYYIEGYLRKAFRDRKLVKQDPAIAIDYEAISQRWRKK